MFQAFRANSRPLLALMLPILGTQLAQTGMGVVDTLVAGMAGTVDLAAIAVGSSIWVPVVLLVSGIMVGLTPLVAQAKGAKDKEASRSALQQGIYLSFIIGLLFMLLMLWLTAPILAVMDVTENLIQPTEAYLTYIAYGLPAVAVYQALRSYNEAVHLTRPITVIAITGLIINIPLNIMFVNGWGPIDAMGGPGCGVASLIVFYLATLAAAVYTATSAHHRKIQPLKRFAAPNWEKISKLTAIGVPIGLAIFVETSLFCVIALLIARLGADVVAAHQITLNVSSLLFMVPLSLALALTVQVGNALGAQNPRKAKQIWKHALMMNLGFACINGTLLITLRDSVIALYSQDIAVAALASSLLFYAAVFQLSDGLQVAAAGALRGYKDTLVTLGITIISFWCIGLPLGYYLGLSQSAPLGAEGFWMGLVVGLSINAALLLIRLNFVSKRATIHAT